MGVHDLEIYDGSEFDIVEQNGEAYKVPRNSTYKYKCLLSQSGTDAPTAVIHADNFIGEIVWTRFSSTQYRATLAGAFPALTTFCYNCTRIDDDTIEVPSAGDDTMTNYPVMFTVNILEVTDVPKNFVAVPEYYVMGLTWDDDADDYILQRRLNDGSTWATIYSGTDDSFSDFDLTPDTEYFYRVRMKEDGKAWSKWAYLTESTDIS